MTKWSSSVSAYFGRKAGGYVLIFVTVLIIGLYYSFENDPYKDESESPGEGSLCSERDQEAEYTSRVQRYMDVCTVHQRNKHVATANRIMFYTNPATNQSFGLCGVAKAGITFWNRVFQFLNRTSRYRNISSPFEITRYQTYFKPLATLKKTGYQEDKMATAERVMFARNPYARLHSAYIDKFILPQFLTWKLYASRVAKWRGYSALNTQPCVTDLVTFDEFVDKVLLKGDNNVHWKPIHTICSPCTFYPNIIGKQESFMKDVKYTLNKVGLGHLTERSSHGSYIKDEIKQLVDFTFSVRDSVSYMRKCFDDVTIVSRLWLTFKMNGYIPSNATFPRLEISNMLKGIGKGKATLVTEYILRVNARAAMSREQHSKQKTDMMNKDYSTLKRESLLKLAAYYDVDFKMFGYEKYPKALFPWKYL